jgi:hypothetical protein
MKRQRRQGGGGFYLRVLGFVKPFSSLLSPRRRRAGRMLLLKRNRAQMRMGETRIQRLGGAEVLLH